MKKVVCIGSALKDVFIPTGDGVVIETPEDITSQRKLAFELGAKYYIEHRYSSVGGCALNIALGLTKLGVQAVPYAFLGGDATGAWIRKAVTCAGVDTSLLRNVSEVDSDLSVVLVDRKTGDRVIFVNHNIEQELVIDVSVVPENGLVFIGSLKGAWQERFAQLQQVAQKQNCAIAYNPGQRNIADDIGVVAQMIAQSEYLFVNKDEATEIVLRSEAMLGDIDRQQINEVSYLLENLRKLGVETVILTAGLEGAWIAQNSKTVFVPSSKEQPLDTTGAGDAFSSGVLGALLHDHDITEAAAWGALNAGNVVKYYGGSEGLLDLSHIAQVATTVRDKVQTLRK